MRRTLGKFTRLVTHCTRALGAGAVVGLTAVLACVVAVLLAPGSVATAGQDRYEYDPIGRLILHVDGQNEVTEYSYDPAGNLLAVRRSGQAAGQAPVISGVSPGVIRRGETRAITLTGQRLQVGTLLASDPGMSLSGVQLGTTQVTANLSVAASVAAGTQTLTFSSAQGTARVAIVVAAALPTLSVEPSPLALPPDNTPRAITLRLSGADAVGHTVNISSSDPGRAIVSPASVVLAAGQTAVQVSVTPKAGGFVNLALSSPSLQPVNVPVFVTTDFRGANTSYAQPVGVQVGAVAAPVAPPVAATFSSARVGVAVGSVLTSVRPRALPVGATHSLVITGAALPGTVQMSLVPGQGVTTTQVVLSQEIGTGQIAARLSVDAMAQVGEHRIVVRDGAGQVIPFADPDMARIRLTTGQPVIESVSPLFVQQGATVRVAVRGRHLHGALMRVQPETDLRVDSEPVVNAAGTELTAYVQVAALAATGVRRVQVVTASGQSADLADSSNQLTIVQAVQHDITPILSPMVGLVVGSATTVAGTQTSGPIQAPGVGVLVGAAAQSVTPGMGVLGTSVTLVVQGVGLQAVQTVTLVPTDGLVPGAPAANPDGTQLSIPLSINTNALRTLRQLRLATAAGRLLFTAPEADQFRVVAPAPGIMGVAPQVVVAGSTTFMTVRGSNFSDVTGVRFEPADGLVPVPPFVATEGNTVLRFAVQVAPGAPSGPRTLVVSTAGGATPAAPSPANTFQVAQQVGPVHDAILAAPVGVLVGSATPEPQSQAREVYAQAVGVVFNPAGGGVTQSDTAWASHVGVLVGPASTSMNPARPDGFLAGGSDALVIRGHALDQITAVTVQGTAGISLGTPVVSGGATQLTVPVQVSATAASGTYGVQLFSGSGTATTRITDANPQAMFFNVGSLPTGMESVSPLVLEQGKTYTFTVRGTGLRDVYQIEASPSEGLRFGIPFVSPQWSTDALGEKLTVQVTVDADAATGSRVVRLRVPGGMTGADAFPANTITVSTPF